MTGGAAGRARPLVKVLPGAVDPLRIFSALSDEGRAPHAFLLESADVHRRNAVRSLGCGEPCLRISGRDGIWSMEALRPTGERALRRLRPALDELGLGSEVAGEHGYALLGGELPDPRPGLEERARLREPGPMDLLRAVQRTFPVEAGGSFPPGGLFGAFSYDFVDCFESLPSVDEQADPLPVPDYVFYLADRLFQVDHIHDRCTIIATVLAAGEDEREYEEEYHAAQDFMRRCAETIADAPALAELPPPPALTQGEVETDLDDAAYAEVVVRMKEHILAGDVFQIVPSRSFHAPLREEPLAVYRRLRELNPSPYMFYLRLGEMTLLGASPETALKVTGRAGEERRVAIRPIAGTKPRGLRGGVLDSDLDSRYESELKLDAKELAEHVMLVDLARNDVARVSLPASRRAERLFVVEKYSHVQHMVSHVSGVLSDELDPLHAYLATMNMGTLTGAPKVEAMRLLRQYEKSRRGFYGGAVGYYLLDGQFDTCIVIRSLLLAGGSAVARAGAGVVYDSVPAREAEETVSKARAPLAALGLETRSGGAAAASDEEGGP